MKWNRAILMLALIATAFCLAGCGKKADENKPLSEVQAEADKMNIDELKAMATTYKDALAGKKDDIQKVMVKLKEIPLDKLVSDDTKQFKQEVEDLNNSLKALKLRFDVYYNKLKEKGEDVSQLSLE